MQGRSLVEYYLGLTWLLPGRRDDELYWIAQSHGSGGAVGHALATAVRRRRHDVAVLRAVGMTRAQSRWVVATQATVLAVVGLLVGVPLGVALGRTVWRYVADTTPLHYIPPVALIALLVVVPVALVAANVLAAWPGHRAASLRVALLILALGLVLVAFVR